MGYQRDGVTGHVEPSGGPNRLAKELRVVEAADTTLALKESACGLIDVIA